MNYLPFCQYSDIKKELKHVEEQLIRLDNARHSPRVSVLSDMPKGPIADHDQMTTKYIAHEKLRDKYQKIFDQLCEKQLQIEETIESLDPIERDLVRYYYIDHLRWSDVAMKLGYSQRHVFRIHDKIIEKIEKMAQHGN